MRYAPAALYVKLGETVRFLVANKGATMHELVLGRVGRTSVRHGCSPSG